jgi:uncharacterized RDD family membrane protein YckC
VWVAVCDKDDQIVLASRWRRLAGALLDSLFQGIVGVVCAALLGAAGRSGASVLAAGPIPMSSGSLSGWVATAVVLTVQGVLITRRGQSMGKILAGTRIVRADGRAAGLLHGFLLRTMPLAAIMQSPTFVQYLGLDADAASTISRFAGLLWFLDAALIFGAYEQCGHDKLAGTFVALAAKEPVSEDTQSTRAPPKLSSKRRRRRDRVS